MIKNTISPPQGLLLIDLLSYLAQIQESLVVGVLPLCLIWIRGFATPYPKTHLLPSVGAIAAPAKHPAASANGQNFEPLTINVSPNDLQYEK